MDILTELGRRALGHLPVWAEDEAAHIAAEGGPEHSIRYYSLADFTARLAEDSNVTPPLDEAGCQVTLDALVAEGFAVRDDQTVDGETVPCWRMTQAGFEAITGPVAEPAQVPGEVTVELQPAVADSNAVAG